MRAATALLLAALVFAACGGSPTDIQAGSAGRAHAVDAASATTVPQQAGGPEPGSPTGPSGPTDRDEVSAPGHARSPGVTATSRPASGDGPPTTASLARAPAPPTTKPALGGLRVPPSIVIPPIFGGHDPTKRAGEPGLVLPVSVKPSPVPSSPDMPAGRLEIRNATGQSLHDVRVVMPADLVPFAVSAGATCTQGGAESTCVVHEVDAGESFWVDFEVPKQGGDRVFRVEAFDAAGKAYAGEFTATR